RALRPATVTARGSGWVTTSSKLARVSAGQSPGQSILKRSSADTSCGPVVTVPVRGVQAPVVIGDDVLGPWRVMMIPLPQLAPVDVCMNSVKLLKPIACVRYQNAMLYVVEADTGKQSE